MPADHHHSKSTRRGHTLSWSRYVRQTAALVFAGTAALEYSRSREMFFTFPCWCMILHFIFFQLPQKSRALVWFHPIAYIASVAAPVRYAFQLYSQPGLELNRMELWDQKLPSILLRTVILNLAPLLFHSLYLATAQQSLILGYSLRPRKLILIWSVLCYPIFGFLFELTCTQDSSNVSDTLALERLDADLEGAARMTAFGAACFAWAVLYNSILKRKPVV